MAYKAKNLSVLAYANGFTQWHYDAGADGLDKVLEEGYFATASDMLRQGDLLFCNLSNKSCFAVLYVADQSMRVCRA